MKALRVMVVEDDAMIAALFSDVLVGLGYDVCAVEATEAGAVAAAVQSKPDLMIVDVRLGEESGVSAVDEILRTGFVPHVFVSGNTSGIRSLRPGAIALQKPFREADLAWAIERALDASHRI